MCIQHIFQITPLMATHNTIMTSNANDVPPRDAHAEFCQPKYKPQTLAQFSYWGNGGSEHFMHPITHIVSKTGINNIKPFRNTIKCTTLQSYIVHSKFPTRHTFNSHRCVDVSIHYISMC
jgi:hypothetical protein